MFFVFFNSSRALDNRAGRKTVRARRSALINMPSWNWYLGYEYVDDVREVVALRTEVLVVPRHRHQHVVLL